MVIAGAYADPVDGALFVWKNADAEVCSSAIMEI